jgi:hypothetical protein
VLTGGESCTATNGGSGTCNEASTCVCTAGSVCNDGFSCTSNDKCNEVGKCVGTPNDSDCGAFSELSPGVGKPFFSDKLSKHINLRFLLF